MTTASGGEILDVAMAILWLARARCAVVLSPQSCLRSAKPVSARPGDQRTVDRCALALRRAARRVPWRSDCLVQAIAGHRWLAALGIASQIHLGTRPGRPAAFHAWLTVGREVVLGGDVTDQVELFAA